MEETLNEAPITPQMQPESPTPTPTPEDPKKKMRKLLLGGTLALALGLTAYMLVGSDLFKGMLIYNDSPTQKENRSTLKILNSRYGLEYKSPNGFYAGETVAFGNTSDMPIYIGIKEGVSSKVDYIREREFDGLTAFNGFGKADTTSPDTSGTQLTDNSRGGSFDPYQGETLNLKFTPNQDGGAIEIKIKQEAGYGETQSGSDAIYGMTYTEEFFTGYVFQTYAGRAATYSWDGTDYNGDLLPAGEYVYIATLVKDGTSSEPVIGKFRLDKGRSAIEEESQEPTEEELALGGFTPILDPTIFDNLDDTTDTTDTTDADSRNGDEPETTGARGTEKEENLFDFKVFFPTVDFKKLPDYADSLWKMVCSAETTSGVDICVYRNKDAFNQVKSENVEFRFYTGWVGEIEFSVWPIDANEIDLMAKTSADDAKKVSAYFTTTLDNNSPYSEPRFKWNGKDNSGELLPAGTYKYFANVTRCDLGEVTAESIGLADDLPEYLKEQLVNDLKKTEADCITSLPASGPITLTGETTKPTATKLDDSPVFGTKTGDYRDIVAGLIDGGGIDEDVNNPSNPMPWDTSDLNLDKPDIGTLPDESKEPVAAEIAMPDEPATEPSKDPADESKEKALEKAGENFTSAASKYKDYVFFPLKGDADYLKIALEKADPKAIVILAFDAKGNMQEFTLASEEKIVPKAPADDAKENDTEDTKKEDSNESTEPEKLTEISKLEDSSPVGKLIADAKMESSYTCADFSRRLRGAVTEEINAGLKADIVYLSGDEIAPQKGNGEVYLATRANESDQILFEGLQKRVLTPDKFDKLSEQEKANTLFGYLYDNKAQKEDPVLTASSIKDKRIYTVYCFGGKTPATATTGDKDAAVDRYADKKTEDESAGDVKDTVATKDEVVADKPAETKTEDKAKETTTTESSKKKSSSGKSALLPKKSTSSSSSKSAAKPSEKVVATLSTDQLKSVTSCKTPKNYRLAFKDIEGYEEVEDAIYSLSNYGIIVGYLKDGTRTFKPNQFATRAEAVKMMIFATCYDKDPASITFKDVKSSDWFYTVVRKGVAMDLIDSSKTSFNPNEVITREEMLKLLVNLYLLENPTAKLQKLPAENPYSNISSKDWFANYAYTAQQIGLTNDPLDEGKRFFQKGKINRADAATLIYNYFSALVKADK